MMDTVFSLNAFSLQRTVQKHFVKVKKQSVIRNFFLLTLSSLEKHAFFLPPPEKKT